MRSEDSHKVPRLFIACSHCRLHVNILRSCRAIHTEAKPLMYSRNKFTFRPGPVVDHQLGQKYPLPLSPELCTNFLRKVAPSLACLIRHLEIAPREIIQSESSWDDTCRLFGRMCNLRELRLNLRLNKESDEFWLDTQGSWTKSLTRHVHGLDSLKFDLYIHRAYIRRVAATIGSAYNVKVTLYAPLTDFQYDEAASILASVATATVRDYAQYGTIKRYPCLTNLFGDSATKREATLLLVLEASNRTESDASRDEAQAILRGARMPRGSRDHFGKLVIPNNYIVL